MIIDSESALLELLGKPLDSSAVVRALQDLGFDAAPRRYEGRPEADVCARDHGLDITFTPAQALRDGHALGVPPNCLVASDLFFHPAGFENYSAYRGVLPYGLNFALSRTAARALLGSPSASSSRGKNDRWDRGPFYLTLDFANDEQSIQQVTLGLPWKPRVLHSA